MARLTSPCLIVHIWIDQPSRPIGSTGSNLPASELHVTRRALREKYGARFHLFALVTLAGRPRPRGGGAVGIEITLEAADAQ